ETKCPGRLRHPIIDFSRLSAIALAYFGSGSIPARRTLAAPFNHLSQRGERFRITVRFLRGQAPSSGGVAETSMHETAGHESRLWIFDPERACVSRTIGAIDYVARRSGVTTGAVGGNAAWP